jgi:hypothetical protein
MGRWHNTVFLFLVLGALRAVAIGQDRCVSFNTSNDTFPVVTKGQVTPIFLSEDDWPGVHRTAEDFANDIRAVSDVKPSITNISTSDSHVAKRAIFVGTLGKSSLIDQIVNNTQLDVSSIEGQWEAFTSRVVQNPLPGVSEAYVIIGADKRGTIFALYDHSEQFGMHYDVYLFSLSNIYIRRFSMELVG